MDALRQTPDNYYDLCVCDPPYGIGEDGASNHSRGGVTKFGGKRGAKGSNVPAKKYTAKSWDSQPPPPEYFTELRRVSKNQIIFGANHFISRIAIDSSCWIVWNKMNGDNDFADCELAWTSFKSAVRKFDFKWNGMLQGNMKEKEERQHPTQKPVALYKWIFQNYSKPSQKILDTHLGSQSSRIAAWDMGLDFYGCEIDKEYFEQGNARFEAHKARPALFPPDQMYFPEQQELFK